MKVFQINSFGNLSTGRIATDIYRTLRENGHEGMVAYGRGMIDDDIPSYRIGNKMSVYADGIMTRLSDRAGFYSKRATKKLIKVIQEYDPDIIHLHNLHGYYINIELLFNYLKESGKPVVWTLHDCWAFTGHCCYFDIVGCEKWKTGCNHCPQKHEYPKSIGFDYSEKNYQKKKELFTSVENMTIITPSKWLGNLTRQSFLNKYPVQVIHNGVNQDVFKPTYGSWKQKNGLEDKKIVLGVASIWTPRKGLNDLIALSKILPSEYKIVVVGLNDEQLISLPKDIIGIKKTNDARELAEIYTAAYVFVNPTYEDNFPSVNLEAMACGTPVISYNTGGSPEAINEKNGVVVPQGDVNAIANAISLMKLSKDEILESSKHYNKNTSYLEYLNLYRNNTSK